MKSYEVMVADAVKLPLADKSVDMVMGSPPYAGKGKRYEGIDDTDKVDDNGVFKDIGEVWADWMVEVTVEALRVCRGPVLWVVNSPVVKGKYIPAVEGLLCGLNVACIQVDRPLIWMKNPAGRRLEYFVNAWEYILVITDAGQLKWNWKTIAQPPKNSSSGAYRLRGADGKRQMGKQYKAGQPARPIDVLYVPVGGGHMGSKLAGQNEAPYPEKLVMPFVKVFTNVGDTVLDPFCGSGTTVAAALKLGRCAIGTDIRQSQVDLTLQRVQEVKEWKRQRLL